MAATPEVVVFVHGLYMTGVEMSLLRARVHQSGFETRQFHYHTVLAPVHENAARLAHYIADIEADTLHLVGHSLGGLVILRMFESGAVIPPGRVVLLGSPVRGSAAARGLVAKHLGWALGRSGGGGLLEQYDPKWDGQRDLGVIAGTGGYGFHPYRPHLDEPHDGLVSVEETRLPGLVDYAEVKTTHMGLLFDRTVVEWAVRFLRNGQFAADMQAGI